MFLIELPPELPPLAWFETWILILLCHCKAVTATVAERSEGSRIANRSLSVRREPEFAYSLSTSTHETL